LAELEWYFFGELEILVAERRVRRRCIWVDERVGREFGKGDFGWMLGRGVDGTRLVDSMMR
jgi:hypothetical protein